MLGYVRDRVITSIPVVLGVSALVFLMLHLLPDDPVMIMLGDSAATPERAAELRRQLGLDDPLVVQYGRFIGNALRGDLGRSIRTNRPVFDDIREQAPSTIQLTIAGLGLAIVLGVTLGVLAGRHRGSWIDTLSMLVALVGVSMPSFWMALLLIFLFALRLG
jgi:ABC-type dipeptide/oligopeptide/nickel transport system permease component